MTETLYAERIETPTRQLANAAPDRRWWVLGILGLAQLMVALDATVVSIALPSAQHSLAFSNSDRQWIVTAYALAFGSLLLIAGRLADRIGRKRVFLIGLVGFAVASAIGGAAVNFTMLVTARAVQGAFGALLAPAVLSLLTTTFTEGKERAKAFGIFGAVAGSGAAIGLLLGGILTEYASWRSTLFVNLIFAFAAFVGGYLLLGRDEHKEHAPLDLPGTIAVSTGLFALVYGFSNAETASWHSPVTIGFLVAAGVLLTAFIVIERRVPAPLLPMRIVLDRSRGGAYLAMFFSSVGMFAAFLFLTYYLETTLQYSAVRTGLAFLPLTGMMIVVASTVSATLGTRISPRILIPSGMFIAGAGMAMLTQIGLHTAYASHILPATMIEGAGLGLVFASVMNLATAGVSDDDAGVASAFVNTTNQVGGSVGTALLNTIAASAGASWATAHITVPGVVALAAVHSYIVTFWVGAGVFVGAGLLAALVLPSGVPQVDSEKTPHVVG
jgi:EmrB/QacA subfamily drug resistance transporter